MANRECRLSKKQLEREKKRQNQKSKSRKGRERNRRRRKERGKQQNRERHKREKKRRKEPKLPKVSFFKFLNSYVRMVSTQAFYRPPLNSYPLVLTFKLRFRQQYNIENFKRENSLL